MQEIINHVNTMNKLDNNRYYIKADNNKIFLCITKNGKRKTLQMAYSETEMLNYVVLLKRFIEFRQDKSYA